MKDGLCRMKRNHIHMAAGFPKKDSVISGMRNSCQLAVEINMVSASIGGEIPFWIAKNNAILSRGLGHKGHIPPAYFRCIFGTKDEKYYYSKP